MSILITGDTHLGGGRVRDLALANNLEQLYDDFLPELQGADLSVTNLESPLIDRGTPIAKTGPNLKSPVRSVQILKHAGFNLLTLANNHIMDFGEEGLGSTLRVCEDEDIDVVGVGKNVDNSRNAYIREKKGFRVGFINIAENEFGTTTSDSPGAHALNPVQNYYQIKQIRENVDFIILIIHGGHENYPLPSPRMKETYRFFVDAGVDAVIGHHPHCFSGFEVYKDSPIFYSLGNFLFDHPGTGRYEWEVGYMVKFNISKYGLDFELIPYIQNGTKAGLRRLREDEQVQFDKKIRQLNKIIADDAKLNRKFDDLCRRSRKRYFSYIEPHSIKFIQYLQRRNLFPSLLSKRKRRFLLNLTRCESHRDVLIKVLQS